MDYPPKSSTVSWPSFAGADTPLSLGLEQETVRLYDEVRLPLLRYLVAFPLPVPDAEDVIHEAFLSLFRSLQRGVQFQNVRGWLFRAVHHLALKKRLRSRKDTETLASLTAIETILADPAPNPEDQFAFQQRRERIMSVVKALPDQHRWCLHLRAEGLRYREIAEIVDVSLGSVSIYLERSLALITRALQR